MDHLEEILIRFSIAVFTSATFCVFTFFQRAISEIITSFVCHLVLLVVTMALIASIVASLTCLKLFKKLGYYAIIPITINIIVCLTPYVRHKFDFFYYKSEREVIVRELSAIKLNENRDYYRINTPNQYISEDVIVVEVHNRIRYVLFYTESEIWGSSNYSGFLYVSDEGDPTSFGSLSNAKRASINLLDTNWYDVSYD